MATSMAGTADESKTEVKNLIHVLRMTFKEQGEALPVFEPISSQTCVVCKRTATIFCTRCAEAPTPDRRQSLTVYYCSPECQEANREQHKPLCNTLAPRLLIRDVHIFLIALWTRYRQLAYDRNLKGFEVEADHYVILDEHDLDRGRRDGFVGAFPRDMFDIINDAHHRLVIRWAAVHFDSGEDAVACMDRFLRQLMAGEFQEIEQVRVTMKTVGKVRLMMRNHHGALNSDLPGLCRTPIWKIKLKSGELWALDPTSLQSGNVWGCMAWSNYCDWCVEQVWDQGIQRYGNHVELYSLKPNGDWSLSQGYRAHESLRASAVFEAILPHEQDEQQNGSWLSDYPKMVSGTRLEMCEFLVDQLDEAYSSLRQINLEIRKLNRRNALKMFMEQRGLDFDTRTEGQKDDYETEEFREEKERIADTYGPFTMFEHDEELEAAKHNKFVVIHLKNDQDHAFVWNEQGRFGLLGPEELDLVVASGGVRMIFGGALIEFVERDLSQFLDQVLRAQGDT